MTANSGCQRRQEARINGVTSITKTDPATPLTRVALPRALPDICFELQAKIDAFLCEQTDDQVLRNVQSQVRVSMGVVQEALRRYG
jgi:FAD synthetase